MVKAPKAANKASSDEEEDYVVERVIGKRFRRGQPEYLIKWQGYGDEDNTWEPQSNLNCPELIAEYEKDRKGTPASAGPKTAAPNGTPASANKRKSGVESPAVSNGDGVPPPKQAALSTPGSETSSRRASTAGRTGFQPGRVVERIEGVSDLSGKLKYIIKWKSEEETEAIGEEQVEQNVPDMVIRFFKSKIVWTEGEVSSNKKGGKWY